MEIIYKGKKKVAFKNIKIGEVFSCYNTLFMSTQEVLSASTGELYNALNLNIGGYACFDDNDEVTQEKAQIIVS